MYDVTLEEPAKDFVRKLDKSQKERIVNKLEKLKENPRLGKPLTASLAGYWSLRIGDYRAIYIIQDKQLVVLVLSIGRRKNVYD